MEPSKQMMDMEEAFQKTGPELFRELARVYEPAEPEDYFKAGVWLDELIKTDIQLLLAHRKEAGAGPPRPLEDVPVPAPRVQGVVVPGGAAVAALQEQAFAHMMNLFASKHPDIDMTKAKELLIKLEANPRRFVIQSFATEATDDEALKALETYISEKPWLKGVAAPKLPASDKPTGTVILPPKAAGATVPAVAGSARFVPASKVVAPPARQGEPVSLESFAASHSLDQELTEGLLDGLKESERDFVLRGFKSASKEAHEVFQELERYISERPWDKVIPPKKAGSVNGAAAQVVVAPPSKDGGGGQVIPPRTISKAGAGSQVVPPRTRGVAPTGDASIQVVPPKSKAVGATGETGIQVVPPRTRGVAVVAEANAQVVPPRAKTISSVTVVQPGPRPLIRPPDPKAKAQAVMMAAKLQAPKATSGQATASQMPKVVLPKRPLSAVSTPVPAAEASKRPRLILPATGAGTATVVPPKNGVQASSSVVRPPSAAARPVAARPPAAAAGRPKGQPVPARVVPGRPKEVPPRSTALIQPPVPVIGAKVRPRAAVQAAPRPRSVGAPTVVPPRVSV